MANDRGWGLHGYKRVTWRSVMNNIILYLHSGYSYAKLHVIKLHRATHTQTHAEMIQT